MSSQKRAHCEHFPSLPFLLFNTRNLVENALHLIWTNILQISKNSYILPNISPTVN